MNTNTKTMGKNNWRRLGRSVMLAAALLFAALPARATDYVFTYNGGYLAVGNNGAVIFTTTLSPQCVWTCVNNYGTETTLSTTSTYLYTTSPLRGFFFDGNALFTVGLHPRLTTDALRALR